MRHTHIPREGRLAALAAALLASACGGDGTPPLDDVRLELDTVATGLSAPVHLAAPAGDARLYVVEQAGRIRMIENGALRPAPFLDIDARVRSGGEEGLLSVAFHPRHAENGYLFVAYTDNGSAVTVERYTRAAGGQTADPASAKTIIVIPHPFSNHNGGQLAFGPDGMLYLAVGDGGGGGDPQGNGQNRNTLLGKLLRLDVDAGDPYAIPAGNPFVGHADARAEIWALGLRNPWRFSFDRTGGTLYVADVGQNAWEEVNAVPGSAAGVNYGWVTMEGRHCYNAATCSQSGLTLPPVEYATSASACAVTGGFVYRGAAMPRLAGHYFYSDYCGGFLRSFRWSGSAAADPREWLTRVGNVTSFGEDAAGELYVLTAGGAVARIVQAAP